MFITFEVILTTAYVVYVCNTVETYSLRLLGCTGMNHSQDLSRDLSQYPGQYIIHSLNFFVMWVLRLPLLVEF
jgi:hypothetical protein